MITLILSVCSLPCSDLSLPLWQLHPGGLARIQHLHHRLASRAVRLGYNVLTIDGDVSFLQDPYLFLKRPPFSAAQLITQGEAAGINVGVMYAQNLSRNGPAAWLWAETADRMVRWADDDGTFLR